MLTPEQAAEFLKVTPATVRDWARRRLIPGRKFGRVWRFVLDELRTGHATPKAPEPVPQPAPEPIPKRRLEAGPPKPPAYHTSKRKAAKLLRTPKWADYVAIGKIYRACDRLTHTTGIQHQVDHIYPLQGDRVSGLHVAENLRVLTRSENARKSNSYDVP